jgi:hypothetical protein
VKRVFDLDGALVAGIINNALASLATDQGLATLAIAETESCPIKASTSPERADALEIVFQ